jgi:hypothetical protein
VVGGPGCCAAGYCYSTVPAQPGYTGTGPVVLVLASGSSSGVLLPGTAGTGTGTDSSVVTKKCLVVVLVPVQYCCSSTYWY